eukprot:11912634-Alexandrium_andersonii.AAC.1
MANRLHWQLWRPAPHGRCLPDPLLAGPSPGTPIRAPGPHRGSSCRHLSACAPGGRGAGWMETCRDGPPLGSGFRVVGAHAPRD